MIGVCWCVVWVCLLYLVLWFEVECVMNVGNNGNCCYVVFWIWMVVFYLVVGVVLGNFMGVMYDFGLCLVYVYINLLGWVSMLGFGLVV